MRITHDPEHNIGYIQFKKPQGTVAKTLCISDDANVDMAADGTVYGIELMNANEQIGTSIIIKNQQTQQRNEYPL